MYCRPVLLLFSNQCIFFKQTTSSNKESATASVEVAFNSSGSEVLRVSGTVEGSEVKLLSVQSCRFEVPASLSGDVIVFSNHKEISFTELFGEY